MKDPIDFYRGTYRAYWDTDYDIVIESVNHLTRRQKLVLVGQAALGLLVIFAVVVLASVQ